MITGNEMFYYFVVLFIVPLIILCLYKIFKKESIMGCSGGKKRKPKK